VALWPKAASGPPEGQSGSVQSGAGEAEAWPRRTYPLRDRAPAGRGMGDGPGPIGKFKIGVGFDIGPLGALDRLRKPSRPAERLTHDVGYRFSVVRGSMSRPRERFGPAVNVKNSGWLEHWTSRRAPLPARLIIYTIMSFITYRNRGRVLPEPESESPHGCNYSPFSSTSPGTA